MDERPNAETSEHTTSASKIERTRKIDDPQEVSQALTQLGRLGEAISKEFTLVSDRMTWLVISNAFMFSAFTTAVTNYSDTKDLFLLIKVFVLVVPVLAILMCFLAFVAILAAHAAAKKLKGKRDRMERRLPIWLRVKLISSKESVHSYGNWPPICIPLLLATTWVILLVMAIASLAN